MKKLAANESTVNDRLDKQTIVDGVAQQIKRALCSKQPFRTILIGLLLGWIALSGLTGCTTAPSSPQDEVLSEQQHEQVAQRLEQALQAEQIGDLPRALSLYSEILAIQPSVRVAERATRMAARLNRWDDVREASSVWRRLDPQSGAARQMQVIANLRTGRSRDAIAILAEAIERAADARVAWQQSIGLLVLSASPAPGSVAQATADDLLNDLLRATDTDPDSAFAWFQRSRMALQTGQPEQALEHALRANEIGPDYINSMWAASLSSEQGQYEQAVVLYAKAREFESEADSDRAIQAALAESNALNRLDRLDESLALLQTLPDTVDTLYARALVLLELDRQETALARWRQMARMAEQIDEAERDRAAWLVAVLAEVLEQNDEAMDWYGRVGGERASGAQLRRAGLMASSGQLEVAREVLATLRAGADPGLTEQAYLVESEFLIEQAQPDAALELLIQAVSEQPANTALLYGRAMAAVQADQLELAEQDLRALIQRDNQNAIALNALGYTLSDRTDRQQEALRLIERALALEPDNPAILDSMGWVLFKLDQPEQALPYLQRAAEGDFHPEIVSHLIEVLWTMGRQDEAERWLARAEPEFFEDAVFADMLQRTGLGTE